MLEGFNRTVEFCQVIFSPVEKLFHLQPPQVPPPPHRGVTGDLYKLQQSRTWPGVRERCHQELGEQRAVLPQRTAQQTPGTRGTNLRAILLVSASSNIGCLGLATGSHTCLPAFTLSCKLTCCKTSSSYERRKLLRSSCFKKDV